MTLRLDICSRRAVINEIRKAVQDATDPDLKPQVVNTEKREYFEKKILDCNTRIQGAFQIDGVIQNPDVVRIIEHERDKYIEMLAKC